MTVLITFSVSMSVQGSQSDSKGLRSYMQMQILSLTKKAILKPLKLPHAARIELQSLGAIIRNGFPDIMLQFLGGIGDELLLTSVAHELRKRDPHLRIWQVSHSAELLYNNPDYSRVFNWNYWPLRYSQFLNKKRLQLSYAKQIIAGEKEIPPDEHIITALCRKAGLSGNVSLKPYFFMSGKEKSEGRLAKRQIAVQCVGPDSYNNVMQYKLWDKWKFQTVVNLINDGTIGDSHIEIIQLGNEKDPLLQDVLDVRGKTSIRLTAAILSNCECFIGTSGFLKHLARAVECRSVIIYGGREHSYQSGYISNENLNSFIECAPCWRWNSCTYNRRCMEMIMPEDVLKGVKRILGKRDVPLETEIGLI